VRTTAPDVHAKVRARIHEQRRQFWSKVGPWLGAFAAMFASDFAWSLYVAAVKDGAAVRASFWAVALFLLGAVAVIGYTKNRWLLVPAAAGAALGTYFGVILQ
jgi:small-conductance mechanosensitive channel